jgi:hypothetical protein
MLFFIAIHQALMGQHARLESLFYYVRIEDQVTENHLLLSSIDTSVSISVVRSWKPD